MPKMHYTIHDVIGHTHNYKRTYMNNDITGTWELTDLFDVEWKLKKAKWKNTNNVWINQELDFI